MIEKRAAKLSWIPVVVLSAIVALVAILATRSNERAELRVRESRLSADLTLTAAHLERTVAIIDVLANGAEAIYRAGPERTDLARRLAGLIAGIDFIVQVSIVDQTGTFLGSNLDRGDRPVDLSDREHIRHHLENRQGGVFIGAPVLGRISNRTTIQVSKLFPGRGGGESIIVVVSWDPSAIARELRTVAPLPLETGRVVRTDGVVLVETANAPRLAVPGTGGEPVRIDDGEGRPWVAGSTAVAGTPLVVELAFAMSLVDNATALFRIYAAISAALIVAGLLVTRSQFLAYFRLQAALAEAEGHQRSAALREQFGLAVQASLDGYVAVDRDGIVVRHNEALERLTGYSRAELDGKPLADLEAVESPEQQVRAHFEKVARDGHDRFESRWRRKDGTAIDVEVSSAAEATSGFAVAFVRDITAANAARERIRTLLRLKSLLGRTNEMVARAMPQDALFAGICEACVSEGGFLLTWIGIADEDQKRIRCVAAAGPAGAYVANLSLSLDPAEASGRGPSATIIREGREIIVDDYAATPLTAPWHAAAKAHGIASAAGFPLRLHGRPVGQIALYADRVGFFDAELNEILRQLAASVSFAMDAADAEAERRRAEAQLRDSEETFRAAFENAAVGIVRLALDGRVLTANEAFCRFLGYPAAELVGTDIAAVTHPDDRRQFSDVVETLRTERRPSVAYEKRYVTRAGETVWARAAVSARRAADGTVVELINAVADVTAQHKAEAEVATRIAQLETALRSTLETAARMVEQRDPYTAGHQRRTGLIAAAIGRELGWDDDRCQRMELTALVHDLGKIGVPAEILVHPGRPDPIRMELIKTHVDKGWEILKDLPFPWPLAEIVRQHHERMDGSGYPRGLAGDAILPEARVLAVADVLESITSHRPYRPALGLDAALDEFLNQRGTLYDAEVVDATVRLMRDKGFDPTALRIEAA